MRNSLLLFSGLILLLFLTACSEESAEIADNKIQILDQQSILRSDFYTFADTISLSGKYLYQIRVVDSIDRRRIAMAADEYFEADTKHHPVPDKFEEYGVYLFVSRYPSLVQMRMGTALSLPARWAGITVGTEYIAIQEIAVKGKREEALENFITKAEKELPAVIDLSWFKRLIMSDLTTFMADETEAFSMPSEGFYGDYILKAALTLRSKQLSSFGGFWLGYVLMFTAAFVLIWLLNKLLFSLLLRKASENIKSAGKALVSLLTGLFFVVPAVGSAVLLSGARIEDQMMLREMGIDGLSNIGFHPDLYNQPTTWYLALLVLLIFLIKSAIAYPEWLVKVNYSPRDQRADYFQFRKDDFVEAGKQNIMVDTGRTEEEADEFALAPYSYLLKKHMARTVYFSIIITLAAYFFIPKAFVLAAVYFWLTAFVKNLFLMWKAFAADKLIDINEETDIETVNSQLEENPNNPALLAQRAEYYQKSAKYEEAVKDYDRLLKLEPENYSWYFQKATALDFLERYDEALKALENAEKNGADTLAVWNNRALIFQKTGKIKEAVAVYDELIKADTKWWLPFYNRATCHYALNQYDKAIADYSKAAELNNEETDICLNRAQALVKAGRVHEAVKDYGELIKRNRSDAESYYQRAALYMQIGRYAKAVSDYESIEEIHKEVEAYPYIADVYRNRATANRKLENYKDAAKDYGKLIEIENTAANYAKRAFMYLKIKDYDKAMDDANKGLAYESDNLELLMLRGSLFDMKGDIPAACKDFKKAIATGKVKQAEIINYVEKNCHPKDF